MAAALRVLVLLIAAVLAAELFLRLREPPANEPIQPLEASDITLPTKLPEATIEAPAPPPQPTAVPLPPAPGLLPPTPNQAEEPAPPLVTDIQPPPPPPQLSDREFYERFSDTIIQIFCQTQEEIFAASGAIVNERGLVLTNAHVAEVVAKAGEPNCQARHGNPAELFANIQIVFTASTTLKIPETDVPQRDVAFLRLVEPKGAFPAAPVAVGAVGRGVTLLTLGYPSEFLQGITTAANSNLVFSALRVDGYADVDGDRTTAEAYVFKGGLVLQQGSSGTALFTRSGTIAGLIFATTKGATTAEREGIALTTAYLDAILRLETGEGLLEFIESH